MLTITRLETTLIVPLSDRSAADLARCGGKGANLAALVSAGFPVPAGFVITTAAYQRFVDHHHLDGPIARLLSQGSGDGAEARAAFTGAAIPADIERAILEAYAALGRGPVAVRSSATAEDLPGAAFAGQQETFLNVLGDADLLDAVRRCWASLWGDRAIAYRQRLALDQPAVKLAVVVQRMVPAEFAGVLFTANPVTGARDEIVLDASPGLGEAVVSGLVTPDHYVLRRGRGGWQVAERRAGRREVIIRARAGGGTEHSPGDSAAPALPDAALLRLADLGAAIQRHFGGPQDIEWAWAGGAAYILQARPITALPSPPPRASLLQRMLASNFGEMLPVRPYPLDLDTWIPALSKAVEPLFALLGLRWSLDRMFEIEDHIVLRFQPNLPRPTWKTLLAPPRLLALILRYRPLQWQADPLLAEASATARDLEALDLAALSWQQVITILREARRIPAAAGELRRRYIPRALFSAARLRLILLLAGRAGLFAALLAGAENKTLAVNRRLEELAQQVRADPTLAGVFSTHAPPELAPALAETPSGRAFLAGLRDLLEQYGHRESIISTALQPTWKDAPDVVLGIIQGFAAQPPRPPLEQPGWQAARAEVLRRPLLRVIPIRRAFLHILDEARALLPLREDTHFYATRAMPVIRRAALELGRRLAGAAVLDTPEDVFHLTLAELKGLDGKLPPAPADSDRLRAAADRRKLARDTLNSTPLVDPRLFPQSAPAADTLLNGTPGSPGAAEGPVCIVRDDSQFAKLRPGDVLVAPYTNPSWTPLFQRAAAVVVDSGSPASHAAIVAREYGIPAVVATVTGTQKLRDGQWVRVDGSRGYVFSAGAPAEEKEGGRG